MKEEYLSKEKQQQIMQCDTFDELLNVKYGPVGTPERDQFEEESDAFILAERLKEERLKAGLTQQQLAERIGTKKSYISRIENGKCDVRLPTLYKILRGLGKRVSVTIL